MAEVMKRFNGTDWGTVSAVNRIVVETIVETPDEKDYRVRFIDYDGTVIQTSYHYAGETVTAPSAPDHTADGLTFQEWNHTSAELTNISADMEIGATYITTDSKTRIHITINPESLSAKFAAIKSDTSTMSINWGDGITTTTAASGNIQLQHTYAYVGEYVVTVWISSGTGSYSLGQGNSSYPLISPSNSVTKVFVGERCYLHASTLYQASALEYITIPNTVTTYSLAMQKSMFYQCTRLEAIVVPRGITSIGDSFIDSCYVLKGFSMPNGITTIGKFAIQNLQLLKYLCLPQSLTVLGTANTGPALQQIPLLEKLTIPVGVTGAFDCRVGGKSLKILGNITSIVSAAAGARLTEFTIPDSVTSIGEYAFLGNVSLTSIIIPAAVTSLGRYAFTDCYGVKVYKLLSTTPPTLAQQNVFRVTKNTRIQVPAASLSAYQAAANWSIYANYMEGY